MKTLFRWMHDPRFGRVLAVLALVSITFLPNALEAQSSGCVAVTYGCYTGGDDVLASDAEQDLAGDLLMATLLLMFLMVMGGSGALLNWT
jgi:hypothetical protein